MRPATSARMFLAVFATLTPDQRKTVEAALKDVA
jgi:hypothetical protein